MQRRLINRRWTKEDDTALLELLRQGKPTRLIAFQLKRSAGAVYTRKSELLRERGSADDKDQQ